MSIDTPAPIPEIKLMLPPTAPRSCPSSCGAITLKGIFPIYTIVLYEPNAIISSTITNPFIKVILIDCTEYLFGPV
jgi:hypothetical protein